ncbi:NAD(P)-dependent dehydrogenase (short-subunit alcohol dehydrogenase family) [Saccharothrix saharensis]|uniref:NAD(P)-dependent dehydrogenase (Short-subunit alcohol dehydrogenase family) n=1 Tax=Saccharothrix saharensis TaxID=571190 RepID=A0A543J793_9PSEU|nr:SDR family NAD(P)-dependent oxidoreductase [Saccharothrix saharensis]TQM78703.1 NAD(P)-dependent dehydrogenase (short-subunit alcohol dehydrogenase family) [Saccharothrix saharensis]
MNDSRLRQAVSGKTVLLTGTARGVTDAVTRHLTRAGAHVLLVAHPSHRPTGATPVYRADPAAPAAMRGLAERLLDEHDRLDVVIHAAGTPPRPASCRGVQHAINTHYVGPSTLIRGLLPALRSRGPAHLITVLPAHIRLPLPCRWGSHRASKAAFDTWFRGLATKTRDRDLTTTTVYTGLVRADPVALICDAITLRPRQIAPWWLRTTGASRLGR